MLVLNKKEYSNYVNYLVKLLENLIENKIENSFYILNKYSEKKNQMMNHDNSNSNFISNNDTEERPNISEDFQSKKMKKNENSYSGNEGDCSNIQN